MTNPPDDPSAMATALAWASRAMALAAEMVAPGLVGLWVDRRLGTGIVFAVIGFGAGMTLTLWQLTRLGKTDVPGRHGSEPRDGTRQDRSTKPPGAGGPPS